MNHRTSSVIAWLILASAILLAVLITLTVAPP
jgi:hypothetical protein